MSSESKQEPRVIVFPSGTARQFRVQYLASHATGWRKFAVYPRRNQAEACVAKLQAGGYEARMVDYRYFPVAG
jgi:hypothetical protein